MQQPTRRDNMHCFVSSRSMQHRSRWVAPSPTLQLPAWKHLRLTPHVASGSSRPTRLFLHWQRSGLADARKRCRHIQVRNAIPPQTANTPRGLRRVAAMGRQPHCCGHNVAPGGPVAAARMRTRRRHVHQVQELHTAHKSSDNLALHKSCQTSRPRLLR